MTELVPTAEIESIVGVSRHPTEHYARAVSAEEQVYILHSRECLDSGVDLRECKFSLALDLGLDLFEWHGHEDTAVAIAVSEETAQLLPVPMALTEGQEGLIDPDGAPMFDDTNNQQVAHIAVLRSQVTT